MSRQRAEDLYWLVRVGGIRSRLVELNNQAGFDRDVIAWHLLRPCVAGFQQRSRRLDGGLLAPYVAELALARPPQEWSLCPECQGSGRGVGEDRCPRCQGAGYQIEC